MKTPSPKVATGAKSALKFQVLKIGARAAKVVARVAGDGEWTTEVVSRAADALEKGDKALGVQRPWPRLAARLRTIANEPGAATSPRSSPDVARANETEASMRPFPSAAPPTKPAARAKASTKPLPAISATPGVRNDVDAMGAGPPDHAGTGVVTLGDLTERFLAALADRGKSLGTRFSYQLDLRTAQRWFSADRDIRTITIADVVAYNASELVTRVRSGVPKSPITSAKLRRVLRMALEFAVESGLLNVAPVEDSVSSTASGKEKKGLTARVSVTSTPSARRKTSAAPVPPTTGGTTEDRPSVERRP